MTGSASLMEIAKPKAFVSGCSNLGGVDANHLPVNVHQRTARVARVNGCIGLNAVDGVAVAGFNRTVECRDIAKGDTGIEVRPPGLPMAIMVSPTCKSSNCRRWQRLDRLH